jgi:hypothetical protein
MRSCCHVVAGLIALTLSGCGVSAAQPAAEYAAEVHYRHAQLGAWQSVLDRYDPAFFISVTDAQWQARLLDLQARLGKYQSRQLVSSSRQEFAGMQGMEHRIILTYRVRYARGEIIETLGFVDRANNGKPTIVSHVIQLPEGAAK